MERIKEDWNVKSVVIVFFYAWDSLYDHKFNKMLFKIQERFGTDKLLVLSANILLNRDFANYFNVRTSPSILVLSRGSGVHNYKGVRDLDVMVPFLDRFLLNETELVPNFRKQSEFLSYLQEGETIVYQIIHEDENDPEKKKSKDDIDWRKVRFEDHEEDPFIEVAKYLRRIHFCRVTVNNDLMSHQKIFLYQRSSKKTWSYEYQTKIDVEDLIDWVNSRSPILFHDLARKSFQNFMNEKQNVVLLFYLPFYDQRTLFSPNFRSIAREEHPNFHFAFANLQKYEELAKRLLPNVEDYSIPRIVLIDWKLKEHHECEDCISSKNEKLELDTEESLKFLRIYRTSCRSYPEKRVNLFQFSGITKSKYIIPEYQFIQKRKREFLVYFSRKQCLHCHMFEKKVLHRTVFSRSKYPTDFNTQRLLFMNIDCERENCNRIEGIHIEFFPYLVYFMEGEFHVYRGGLSPKEFLEWIENLQSEKFCDTCVNDL